MSADLLRYLAEALDARMGEPELRDERRQEALRLFNGFTEGAPGLVADLYARTLLVQDYSDPADPEAVETAQRFYLERLPWIRAVVVKVRRSPQPADRQGRLTYGEKPDRRVREHDVWYALELLLHQDASLYLDTRNLRRWALDNLAGKRVLNTFAYTGSLGVAAAAGGAERVLHIDLNRTFLNLAKDSYSLNGLPVRRADFLTGDFWSEINRLKRAGETFDCVFVDPPFFSLTERGRVDLVNQSQRVINKVRPLIADGGKLVAINNALFVSGQEYMDTLQALCADGYLQIETLIPVPPDFTGYASTRRLPFPTDPAPFNHPTKIAVLSVRRKNG